MKRLLLFAALLTGCCGKQNCPPPPIIYPAPSPPLFSPEVIVPEPVRTTRVEKCFKFIVAEDYPYANGPDLKWEMSWKW